MAAVCLRIFEVLAARRTARVRLHGAKKNAAVEFGRQAASVEVMITARFASGRGGVPIFPGERLMGGEVQR